MCVKTKPVYKHDCSGCTYLGTVTFDSPTGIFPNRPSDYAGTYDLYFCTQGGNWPTLIARFSDEGRDCYTGGTFGRKGAIAPLVAAYGIAVSQGLCTPEGVEFTS